MGKLLKFLAGLVVVLVLLVVAAAIVAPLVVDPNDFRGEIVAQVKKATGRDLKIDGDIGLSVFPWLGVELNDLELGQPPGFGDQPFAAVKHAQVRAKLMPLLEKKLEVDTLQVEGLQLNMIRNKHGMGNWEDLAHGEQAAAAPESKQPAEAPATGGLSGLAIGGIQVADARVSWDDRQSGQQVTIQNLDLETGNIVPGEPMDLKLGFSVDNRDPALKGRIRFAATVTQEADGQRLKITPFELKLSDFQTGDGMALDLTMQAALALDLAAGNYRIDGLSLSTEARGPQLPGGNLEARLDAGVLVDLPSQTLNVDKLDLTAAGLHLTGQVGGSKILTAPSFSGRLALDEFDPRGWLQKVGMQPPETADPAVLGRLALSTDLKATPSEAALDNLRIVLDDSNLTGNARILLGKAPGYRFALTLDSMNLDRYLPPKAEQPAPAAAKPAAGGTPPAAVAEQPLFPVETLRALDVDGSFSVGSLIVSNLKLEDALIKVKARNGRVSVDQQVKRFYQGSLGGNLGLDVSGNTPRLSAKEQAANIQAEPLVKDLTGQDRLSGAGRFDMAATANGQTVRALKRSLDGNMSFVFNDGAVKGINLAYMVRKLGAALKGQSIPEESGAEQTDFSELSASAVIKNGVLTNNDLNAKSPLFRVNGHGTVNLVQENMDYRAAVDLVASLQGQGGKAADDLKGVKLPLRVYGPFSNLEKGIDREAVLQQVAKAKLGEKLEKAVPKNLQDKLPGGLLNQLTGGGQSAPTEAPPQPSAAGQTQPQDDLKKKLLKGLFK